MEDNQCILIYMIINSYFGIITVTIILYLFCLSIIKRKKEKGKLSEKHSPYDFESSQQNVINKSFNFQKYLYSGDYVKVIKAFKDYDGFIHPIGEKWYFACQYFLESEYGDVLYISTDKINIDTIYLEDREDNLYAHPEEYFKILEQGRFKKEVF